jgi:amino-acid N-acetyltransferase
MALSFSFAGVFPVSPLISLHDAASDKPGDERKTRDRVAWVRSAAPYIHAFRNKTFVIGFGGEVADGALSQSLAYDCNLLAALGLRLVLVHGARPPN